MDTQILSTLREIADELDAAGRVAESDALTQSMQRLAQFNPSNPLGFANTNPSPFLAPPTPSNPFATPPSNPLSLNLGVRPLTPEEIAANKASEQRQEKERQSWGTVRYQMNDMRARVNSLSTDFAMRTRQPNELTAYLGQLVQAYQNLWPAIEQAHQRFPSRQDLQIFVQDMQRARQVFNSLGLQKTNSTNLQAINNSLNTLAGKANAIMGTAAQAAPRPAPAAGGKPAGQAASGGMNYFQQAGIQPQAYRGTAEQNEMLRRAIDPRARTFYEAYLRKFGVWDRRPSSRVQKLMGAA